MLPYQLTFCPRNKFKNLTVGIIRTHLKLIQGILHVFKCAVFVVLAHSVFRLHFFFFFFVYFRNNSYLCPWKQLVHGLGYVFKTYWFDAHTAMPREGTTAMTSRKDVYRTLIFYFQKSGKLSRNYKKIAQSKRPRGWFYITTATFYIVIYNRCCTRI